VEETMTSDARIELFIDDVKQDYTFGDADTAVTWAEMNSKPGQKLRLHMDYVWESPEETQ
jgi:hypothetical protein